jgi:hypothetical protein
MRVNGNEREPTNKLLTMEEGDRPTMVVIFHAQRRDVVSHLSFRSVQREEYLFRY